ncbi:MAG: hypothetical protein IKC40_06170, partial [Oscillospiraceae bacterium]|nr:hypothetical protein [Oscillospiraceae bacterium]
TAQRQILDKWAGGFEEMANNESSYKVAGYTTPRGVNDSRSVKEWQRKLGVTPDGIWGKNTQAAYDKYLANPVTLPKDDRGAQKRSLRVLDTMGKLGESKASYGASAVGAGRDSDLSLMQEAAADVKQDSTVDAYDASYILSYSAERGAGSELTFEEYMDSVY